MKKWLTGLLSGSPDEKKKGTKGMAKAKPAKATPKAAAKAAKPAAKPKAEAKAAAKSAPKATLQTEPKAKAAEAKPAKAAKPAKFAPAAEKMASPVEEAPAPKAEKKPKKGAAKEEIVNAAGIVDTASPENKKKWRELREKFAKEKAQAYSMSAQFEAEQPLEHKVLGWGYIMTNNNDRLEVLFETGVKILISNYRS